MTCLGIPMSKPEDMKSQSAPFVMEEMNEQYAENVFPYARLSCVGVSEIDIKKIALHLPMKVIPCENDYVLHLTPLHPQPGEHKLQVIEFFAQMLLLNKIQPHAKMSLSLQVDFMNDLRPVLENPAREFQDISPGSLKVSAACQLFLSQAGFDIKTSDHDAIFQQDDIRGFLQFLLDSAPLPQIAKRA